MNKYVNKRKFEIFNDIYDNAEKKHDMVIISHSKSDWIAIKQKMATSVGYPVNH